jgi:hypothetical protein
LQNRSDHDSARAWRNLTNYPVPESMDTYFNENQVETIGLDPRVKMGPRTRERGVPRPFDIDPAQGDGERAGRGRQERGQDDGKPGGTEESSPEHEAQEEVEAFDVQSKGRSHRYHNEVWLVTHTPQQQQQKNHEILLYRIFNLPLISNQSFAKFTCLKPWDSKSARHNYDG